MELFQEVYDAAQHVILASGPTVAQTLNRFIGRFVGWPFKTASGFVRDRDGNRTEAFASVIHTASENTARTDTGAFPADAVAAVIDACESLDLENLRARYGRITQAKRLQKATVPELRGTVTTTVTLGIILALRSALPLEVLAEEVERLNTQIPGRERPDMIVVASIGTIGYAAQFPGEGVPRDFLPPAEGALNAYTPPMYVVMLMRPTGGHTLNKALAFLIAHLAVFSPGARLPPWIDILKGVSQHAVTLCAYQYNQRGELLPVPRQFYNDRFLAPLPVRLEDHQGNLLSTLQFLPWQDGGTILLRGKLPLEGLLVFLDKAVLRRGGVIMRPDVQISYVLPITQTDFGQMLARIQRQTNLVVRPEKTNWVVQKVADEGSQSPFMARLFIGILRLRDLTLPVPNTRDRFDKAYEFVLTSLSAARAVMQQLVQVWEEHARKVASGEVARLQGRTIHIDANIDRELGQQADGFLNAATRTLKEGMQGVAAEFQVNIGWLFQKRAACDAGLLALEASDPALAEYLRQARAWSERLQERRNAVEHERWILPRVTYVQTNGGVKGLEPLIDGQPISEFVTSIFDRLTCLVEEVTAHWLQRRMPAGITITEIAPADRAPEMPERFRVTLANGGMTPWAISFHPSSFEET